MRSTQDAAAAELHVSQFDSGAVGSRRLGGTYDDQASQFDTVLGHEDLSLTGLSRVLAVDVRQGRDAVSVPEMQRLRNNRVTRLEVDADELIGRGMRSRVGRVQAHGDDAVTGAVLDNWRHRCVGRSWFAMVGPHRESDLRTSTASANSSWAGSGWRSELTTWVPPRRSMRPVRSRIRLFV